MKSILSSKDFCRIESFLKTDVAGFSLWNSSKEGSHIDIETGSDGNFKIITLFNQDISEQDLPLVHKSEKGIQLSVEGPVYLGSTEWMKESGVSDAAQNNYVDSLELPSGNYVVNVYSILMKDASGKPEFIQFVFSIISESKFVNKGEQLHTATQPISLKYTA